MTISGRAVAVEVGDRRRGDDLGAVGAVAFESFAGKPGQRVAVAVPRVDVLVERTGDDVEVPSPSRSASAGEPKKPRFIWFSVGDRAVGGVEARMRRPRLAGVGELRVEPHGEAVDSRPVEAPGVDVLAGRGDDLGLVVAVDVADGRHPQRLARRVAAAASGRMVLGERQRSVWTGWPPLKLATGVPSAWST